MDLPIKQIVDLYQIKRFGFQESHRASHLGDPGLSPLRPYFGCGERLGLRSRIVKEIADDCLRFPVHWRTVDERSAVVEQRSEHISKRFAFRSGRADVEGLPSPASDDGKQLPRRRDRAFQHGLGHVRSLILLHGLNLLHGLKLPRINFRSVATQAQNDRKAP